MDMMDNHGRPLHRHLPHRRPDWVRSDALYFITACAEPRGVNALCRPEVADGLFASVDRYAQLGKWWPTLVLLMPDHLHALMTFGEGADIARTFGDWKRYTGRMFGVAWQKDFFEHRLRHDESLREKGAYIAQNPVRAGLAASAEEWQYVRRWGWPV